MPPIPIELKYLVWSALLTFVMILTGSIVRVRGWTPAGTMALFGNRDDVPPAETGLAGRAERAWRNMLENFVLFAALVLAAKAAGVSNANTVLGAQLFFWARLAYFPIYLIGIPFVRTLAWLVAVVGMAMIALQLL